MDGGSEVAPYGDAVITLVIRGTVEARVWSMVGGRAVRRQWRFRRVLDWVDLVNILVR